jgi:hypothetical protein
MFRMQVCFLPITAALMAGCATSPTCPQQAVPISTFDLCYRVIKYPGSHLYYESWLNELKKRGEDCSNLREQITLQVKTENEAERLRGEEYEKHQRQLELEAAKAPKTIINQPAPIFIPDTTRSNCWPDGWGGFHCDNY